MVERLRPSLLQSSRPCYHGVTAVIAAVIVASSSQSSRPWCRGRRGHRCHSCHGQSPVSHCRSVFVVSCRCWSWV
jgi:hypothetical protein